MKERPILFSAPMVRALLDGSKTQTRRVCKPQPFDRSYSKHDHRMAYASGRASDGDEIDGFFAYSTSSGGQWQVKCPYGQPGDRLWVRETFFAYGRWETRYSEKKKRDEWHFVDMTIECDRAYQYGADNPEVPLAKGRGGMPGWYSRPSIHMPRHASRTVLDVTALRVERLNDCSEADADAEGCERLDVERYDPDWRLCSTCGGTRLHRALGPNGGVIEDVDCLDCDTYTKRYRHLWESINGAGSWEANPWVWVVEFKRVQP